MNLCDMERCPCSITSKTKQVMLDLHETSQPVAVVPNKSMKRCNGQAEDDVNGMAQHPDSTLERKAYGVDFGS